MKICEMFFPENSNNINVVRKLAKEKDYTLKMNKDKDGFDLVDNQTNKNRFCKASLEEVYDYLLSMDA